MGRTAYSCNDLIFPGTHWYFTDAWLDALGRISENNLCTILQRHLCNQSLRNLQAAVNITLCHTNIVT